MNRYSEDSGRLKFQGSVSQSGNFRLSFLSWSRQPNISLLHVKSPDMKNQDFLIEHTTVHTSYWWCACRNKMNWQEWCKTMKSKFNGNDFRHGRDFTSPWMYRLKRTYFTRPLQRHTIYMIHASSLTLHKGSKRNIFLRNKLPHAENYQQPFKRTKKRFHGDCENNGSR